MAVRVRKLARELDRSPEDLLVLLRDLGYERFRSSDDMISEVVAEHLRRAARTTRPRAVLSRAQSTMPPSRPPALGSPRPAAPVSAAPVAPERSPGRNGAGTHPPPRRSPTAAAPAEPPEDEAPAAPVGGDFMSRLVPGVRRQREHASHGPSPGRSAIEAEQVKAERAELEAARAALQEERRDVRGERDAVAADRAALEARAAEVERMHADLAAAAEELARAREAFLQDQRAASEGSLLGLLEERGLRGLDEAERTVAVLAGSHAFGRVLGQLVPVDPVAVRRVLAERLVLVEGNVPEGLGVPSVVVSGERADVPAPDRVARTLSRIGERCLLHGMRRVVLVGVPARWHGVLREGLDRRVELVFRPTAAPSGEQERVDAWVHWSEPDAAGVRRTDRPAALGAFLDRWLLSLVE